MSCSSNLCECCNPYVFTESLAQAHGYDEDSLPDLLWGISPKELRNVTPEDVFAYEWIECLSVDAKNDPHIVVGKWLYKGVKLA